MLLGSSWSLNVLRKNLSNRYGNYFKGEEYEGAGSYPGESIARLSCDGPTYEGYTQDYPQRNTKHYSAERKLITPKDKLFQEHGPKGTKKGEQQDRDCKTGPPSRATQHRLVLGHHLLLSAERRR